MTALRFVLGTLLAVSFAWTTHAHDHRPELLQTAAAVQQELADGTWRVLDVRDQAAYAAGHIPGAVHVDLPSWTKQSSSSAKLTDPEFWSAAVGQLGVGRNSHVLVYGADAASAARAWWLLRFVGVERVSLLDGGWRAWQQAGYSVETEPASVSPRSYRPRFQLARLMDMPELLRSLDNPKLRVWDSRSDGEYTGADVKGSRPGRVPGAVHLEWVELLDETGCFKTPAAIRALLQERGIAAGDSVVTYCYSGGRSSVAAFALELAGLTGAKNYYCGWQEWSADKKAPAQVDAQKPDAPR